MLRWENNTEILLLKKYNLRSWAWVLVRNEFIILISKWRLTITIGYVRDSPQSLQVNPSAHRKLHLNH
jgi:hypothetical protein